MHVPLRGIKAQQYFRFNRLATGVKLLVMVAMGQAVLTAPALAQTPPRAIEPRPQPTLPPPEELLEPPPSRPPLEVPEASPEPDLPDAPLNGEVTLMVNRFEVVGSTVFTEDELQAVLAPFTGSLTLAELLEARSAVTQLYIEAGYVSSGAYIPPQEPENGVVTMQVVEGRLAEIEVQGTSRLHPAYVRNRLALGATPPLKIDSLVEQLRLLQLDPLIANISGELSAGLEPGTNRLVVTVEEADSFDVDFVTNNQRSPLVGTWERGLFLNEGNLSGLGDRMQVGYLNTNGSDRAIADYRIPLNARNGTLGAHFEYTHSQVITEPEAILGITTDSLLADLSFRQPIIRTPTEELALSLVGSWQRSRTVYLEELTGQAFPFPAFGANGNGEIEVFALRFGQDWTNRSSSDVIAARSQFNLGLGGSTPTNSSGNAPDGNFFSWLGQAQWAKLLAPDTLLLVRGKPNWPTTPCHPRNSLGWGGSAPCGGIGKTVC
jgi:hemolysin activation/secretion protein